MDGRLTGGKETLLDARGHRCPVPTLRLRRLFADAPAGARVRLLADDAMAQIDVPHWAASAGVKVLELSRDGETLTIVLRKCRPRGEGEGRGAPRGDGAPPGELPSS